MKAIKKLLSVVVLMVIFVSFAFSVNATGTSAVAVPSKPTDSYILDLASLVTDTTESNVNQRNSQLSSINAEVFVVTINSTGDNTIEEFAKMIFTNWKIGGETENGILFLINENTTGDTGATYYALAGVGLNSYFGNDILKNLIKQDVEPDFAISSYDMAVDSFVKACVEEITGAESILKSDYKPEDATTQNKNDDGGILGAIFGFFINLFLIILIIVVIGIIALVLLNIRAQNIRKKRRESRRGSAKTHNSERAEKSSHRPSSKRKKSKGELENPEEIVSQEEPTEE